VGVDENTCAVFTSQSEFEVIGEGKVTVINSTAAKAPLIVDVHEQEALVENGVVVRFLHNAETFCLNSV
jgi:cyanophycinase-like exopeptidase